ncbi:MAG: hypothetical protein K1Y02_03590 [Candidatus Hydrogenedentes bacterium]|nr:hypothetical protein [Candidatus Hydrogenedentota bacterium]
MTSLIDNVLALESQADQVLSDARKEADRIGQRASEEIDKQRHEIDMAAKAKTESQRAAIEEQLAADLARIKSEHSAALARLDQIAAQVIPKQADRIVHAFLED